MNKRLLAVAVVLSSIFGAGLGGCFNDDASSKGRGVDLKDPASVALTKITSPNQAAQAASASRDAAGGGGDMAQTDVVGAFRTGPFRAKLSAPADRQTSEAIRLASKGTAAARNLFQSRGLAQRLRSRSAVASKAVVEACNLGGTVSEDASATGNSYEVTVIYSKCDEGSATGFHEVTNGTVKMSGTQTAAGGNFVATVGDGNADLESGDFTVTSYDGTIQTDSIVMSLTESASWTGDIDGVSEVPFEFTLAGRSRIDDAGFTETVAFDDFSLVFNIDMNTTDSIQSSLTFNGAVEVVFENKSSSASPDSVAYLGFVNFTYSNQTNGTSGGDVMTIDGKVVVEHTPAACGDGAYNFATTTPFQWNSSGVLTAGHMTINDNVTLHANGDGTVTVTVSGTQQTYSSFSEMENSVCLSM